ncbi:hypothetical protein J2T18_000239 [Paenibacillus polymyxa]|uniref:hypothetical protein n=1 Tax=Paenibacillus polymyxa TaxID=1406 RepID=UPI0027948881|nr:hypothetical protein [Paenibacillus polymyxa]MDQ0045967.1 hypothetical protein [Paenibacillus polymyxa]
MTFRKSSFQAYVKRMAPNSFYLRAVHISPLPVIRGLWVNLTSGKKVIGGASKENAEDLT